MKPMIAALVALFLSTSGALAVELRIVPAEAIVLNQANGRGYNDLVVHAVVVATEAGETIEVRGIRIELIEGGAVVETRNLAPAIVAASTQRLTGAPFPEAVGAQVLHPRGLHGLFGRSLQISDGPELEASTALVASALYFATQAAPDTVRVTLEYRAARQRRLRNVSATASVARYQSPITHAAPVTGIWTQQAVPTLQSHHRLNPSTEYAVDFFRLDENGELYRGDALNAANSPAYGGPVLATADGVVVSVVGDERQDRAALTRRADETPQQAGERIGRYMQERLARDFRRAAAGNLVVIRHEAGGVVEYSSYGHLRAESVRVAVGQSVRQGDVIAEVGDTGDSAAVHLHYQLNRGDDPFMTQSLPVRFANLRNAGGNSELGRIVVTR
jgi:murein DD-endopeptidase MepM/ murein hydrolase activator NlpD